MDLQRLEEFEKISFFRKKFQKKKKFFFSKIQFGWYFAKYPCYGDSDGPKRSKWHIVPQFYMVLSWFSLKIEEVMSRFHFLTNSDFFENLNFLWYFSKYLFYGDSDGLKRSKWHIVPLFYMVLSWFSLKIEEVNNKIFIRIYYFIKKKKEKKKKKKKKNFL